MQVRYTFRCVVPSFLSVPQTLQLIRRAQIVLSHFSRSTEDLGVLESFAHRQLRTTMDVSSSTRLNRFCISIIAVFPGDLLRIHRVHPRRPRQASYPPPLPSPPSAQPARGFPAGQGVLRRSEARVRRVPVDGRQQAGLGCRSSFSFHISLLV